MYYSVIGVSGSKPVAQRSDTHAHYFIVIRFKPFIVEEVIVVVNRRNK